MKNPRFTYFIIFYFICNLLPAQNLNWLWEKGLSEQAFSGTAVCTDLDGNVYVAGSYSDSAALVKYNTSGNMFWVRNPDGPGSLSPADVAADPQGNIYMTGNFTDTVLFGSNMLISSGGENTFIVKYDSLGNVIWTQSISGNSGNGGTGLSTDANSNVYITGYFSGVITVGQLDLTQSGAFIAKYDGVGNVQWAKSAEVGQSMHTDTSGNSYLIGSIDEYGGSGIFIVKYDNAGNVAWTNTGNAPNYAYANDYGYGITSDLNGNVYAVGEFSDTLVFGSYTLPCSCPNTGGVFMVKLDPSGNVLWLRGTGALNAYISVWDVAVDNKGNAAMAGDFNASTIVFDTITLSQSGNGNISYVVEYSPSGSALWASTIDNAGGINDDDRIAADTFGNIYVTGIGGDPVFGTSALSYSGSFVAKFGEGFPSGIMDAGNIDGDIIVYPNPTGSEVYFWGVTNGYVIKIYDVLGGVVSSAAVERNTYSVNLDATGKGVYLYKIMYGMLTVKQGKIIVE